MDLLGEGEEQERVWDEGEAHGTEVGDDGELPGAAFAEGLEEDLSGALNGWADGFRG